MSDFVTLVKTTNRKLGRGVFATYAPIAASCPTSCPFQAGGCYAKHDFVGMHERRLSSRVPEGTTPEGVARAEAAKIVAQAAKLRKRGKRAPLRLHVSGDARTPEAAAILGEAARSWPGRVWTYTHAWRDVPRAAWGDAPNLAVLASCETPQDVRDARAQGYASSAIVVESFESEGRAYPLAIGVQALPCPAQTRGRDCASCGLCLSERTGDRVIAFALHGSGTKRGRAALESRENARKIASKRALAVVS